MTLHLSNTGRSPETIAPFLAMYEYRIIRVVKVVDGDTLDLLLDLGFRITYQVRVRLLGLNTPEVRTRDAEEKRLGLLAQDFVQNWCDRHCEMRVQTTKTGSLDKYGRLLARIYSEYECLNDELLRLKYADPYP